MVRSSGRGTSATLPIAVDDIDKMRQRANSNNLFLYIKIPEVSKKVYSFFPIIILQESNVSCEICICKTGETSIV